jgi:hypothetical protein
MTHQDALQEMAVERYLLGELSGGSLERFEEHLFECPECAMDLKTGVIFIDAARSDLSVPGMLAASEVQRAPNWTSWLTNPWLLAPAVAACFLVVAFQTFVLLPRMKREVATAQAPAVLNRLVLANAGPRGDSIPEIVAPEHGSFLISVDVPTPGGFSSYRCSLYTPDGSLVWQTSVSPEQARDALLISMPTDRVKEGLNVFLIQGLVAGDRSTGRLEDLARYRFRAKIQK